MQSQTQSLIQNHALSISPLTQSIRIATLCITQAKILLTKILLGKTFVKKII
jgi:hypothetical protein